jgi:hypothetical protein
MMSSPAIRPVDLKNDRPPNRPPSHHGKRALRALVRFLIAFCIGVAFTLVWQSFGDAAREMIAISYPQLGWLAPRAEPVDAAKMIAPATPNFDQQRLSLDLDAVRQNIDRIAITQEQISRRVDVLAAHQEQMTHDLTNKLQAAERDILDKIAEPVPRPAPASARNSVRRP